MVSFWPWKGDASAASFEKTLSTLATKISKTAAKNDSLRQSSRRVRLMWSLYAGFAYILTLLILVLVTGWGSWGIVEYSVVAGAPLLIYSIRRFLTAYYDYRISNTQLYLESLYKERDTTIQRLKEATKYDSTQQLLEKYGSQPKPPKPASPSANRRKSQGPQKAGGEQHTRTGILPPPTANIPRNQGPQPNTPQRAPSTSSPRPASSPQRLVKLPSEPLPGAEFAPNAFASSDQPRQYSAVSAATYTQHNWYDRILDVLLGEDETQPKNRLALICDSCALVNGQAPPGTRSLEDVGRWRCGGCAAWNGKEMVPDVGGLVEGWEAERRAREEDGHVSSEHGEESVRGRTGTGGVSEEEELHTDEGSADGIVDELVTSPPPAQSTRSKSKAKSEGESEGENERPKIEEKLMTEAERKKKRKKTVLYLRHKLQKGFLIPDQTPKEEEMANISWYFRQLEAHADLEAEIIRKTKIHKVLRAIIKLNSIPKDEEYQFKKRSNDLLNGWDRALAADVETPTTGEGQGKKKS